MSGILAITLAVLTGQFPSPDSLGSGRIAVRSALREISPAVVLESQTFSWLLVQSRTVAPDYRASVAMFPTTREEAEETSEIEEEESEDEHNGRPFASAGLMLTTWYGSSSHATSARSPSLRHATRSLFLLCGRLTC